MLEFNPDSLHGSMMPSLALILLLAVGAACLAAMPPAGAWLGQLMAAGPVVGPGLLAGGWVVAWLGQALAAWLGWRAAGRHAAPWLGGIAMAMALWTVWPWFLLHWNRPGWSLGVLVLAGLLQLALVFRARALGAATMSALLPPAAWLALLGWFNYAWWRGAGGGAGSLFG